MRISRQERPTARYPGAAVADWLCESFYDHVEHIQQSHGGACLGLSRPSTPLPVSAQKEEGRGGRHARKKRVKRGHDAGASDSIT